MGTSLSLNQTSTDYVFLHRDTVPEIDTNAGVCGKGASGPQALHNRYQVRGNLVPLSGLRIVGVRFVSATDKELIWVALGSAFK